MAKHHTSTLTDRSTNRDKPWVPQRVLPKPIQRLKDPKLAVQRTVTPHLEVGR